MPEVSDSKIPGLREQYCVTDARTLQFFEIHKSADVWHRQVLKDMLDKLPEPQKQEAAAAAEEAATALWDFLTEVHGCDDCARAA